jgi:hypothetical protein
MGQTWRRAAVRQRPFPGNKRVQKDGESQIAVFFGVALQIPRAAFEQGSCADEIPSRVMMEGNRDLNQSLQKSFLFRRCRAPNVFPDLVGVEEAGTVKEVKGA